MMDDELARAERIGRYLDAEMDSAERAAFEADLAVDPALAQDLARITSSDDRLRSAFELPVDDAMIARLGLAPAAPAMADVVNLADVRRAREAAPRTGTGLMSGRWKWTAGVAIAASLAIAVAIPMMRESAPGGNAAQAFQVAMETLPSGQAHRLSGREMITPVLSFADGAGRYCREYSIAGAAGQSGIACREAGGHWVVEGRAGTAHSDGPGGEIRTAAGDDGAALDAIYARLNASDPLDGQQESVLISNKWKSRVQ